MIQNKKTETIYQQTGYKKRRNRQKHIYTLLAWVNGGTKKQRQSKVEEENAE